MFERVETQDVRFRSESLKACIDRHFLASFVI